MKNKLKIFFGLLLIILCVLCIAGCQSTDKTNSFFNDSNFEQAIFEYDVEENKTKVTFNATLTNNTIYNFNSFSVKLKLYNNSALVSTETFDYGLSVKNGKQYAGNFSFHANGEVNSIELVSWSANYDSFWETYKIWIIVSIIIVAIAFVVYVIFMIIKDLDLDDSIYFIEDCIDEFSIPAILLLVVFGGGAIWGIISSYWVPVLIVLGAFVSLAVLISIAHLIKYIIEEISFCDFDCVTSEKKIEKYNAGDFFDNQVENVCDYIKDPEKLELFTVQQLKEYCQNNNLRGYSKLNKVELIALITACDIKQEYLQKNVTTKSANSLEELDKLIGLESVKTQLKRIRAILLKNKDSNEKLNLHMCFYGNPGTGKTVVARLMANIFYETGVLPKNKLIETDRSGLCGQTAPLTHKKVKEAMGGVLFIDEAYTLCADSSSDDYGKEAIAALLKDMEDYKGQFCVILAGYKEEMEKMIALNPGFDSRINRKIDFPDYTIAEQMQIFDIMLAKKKYEITDDAKNKLLEVFEKVSKSKNFANARTVRNILDELIEIQAVRTMEDDDKENDSERIIRLEDIEQYYNEL